MRAYNWVINWSISDQLWRMARWSSHTIGRSAIARSVLARAALRGSIKGMSFLLGRQAGSTVGLRSVGRTTARNTRRFSHSTLRSKANTEIQRRGWRQMNRYLKCTHRGLPNHK